MRERALFGNQLLNRWTARVALKFAGLLVQPSQSAEFFILFKLRLPDGRLQHVDRLVIDLERHREWIPVLPTMRERKSRRVTETTWAPCRTSATIAKACTVRAPTPGVSRNSGKSV